MQRSPLLLLALFVSVLSLWAQAPTATIDGRILDPTKAVVEGATVEAINIDTNVKYGAKSNSAGLFIIGNLPPGSYRLEVSKPGFRTIVKPDLVLHVQDVVALNFDMPVGSISESITVTGGAPLVNSQDASVSTVVDRNFADNLPMNGRSFQALIDLTPGVVLTAPGGSGEDSGQFSVNGQRASSNYWMVDGVSANASSGTGIGGNQAAGAVGTTSVLGGTNGLVSVDAMQEFRIQTSTFAPEFGRTPGAQISIVTRSGGNQFHGSAFDYLRNDVLDANDWFNGYTNNPPLRKAEERQNDFGGTFSGPILKSRTFFFASYEGFRLRLPTTALTSVPNLQARQNAVPAMQPYLNAYPLDPNQPDLGNGAAQFNASYSNPATLDAYSLRIDHKLASKLTLFGRYNYSPSEIHQRGLSGVSLSSVTATRITIQTATLGSTWTPSANAANELRFNYSRTNAFSRDFLDTFGGATSLTSLGLPSPYTPQNAELVLCVFSLRGACLTDGSLGGTLQRQLNLVDNVYVQKGTHSLKFGADYRRLSPIYGPVLYQQDAFMLDVASAENGSLFGSLLVSQVGATLLFHNLSAFAQDAWHVIPRLTVTYGLRWDTDFAPSSASGPHMPAVTGFNLSDLSSLALAPAGTPTFKTTYGNFAPRIGIAYQLSQRQNLETVAKGGFGVFYDLATSETANLIIRGGYPFSAFGPFNLGGTFPLSTVAAAPPPIDPPTAANQGRLSAFDPNFKLPYTLQWNFGVEQGLGERQSLSASYVGAVGRRLIQTTEIISPNPNIGSVDLAANTATSDYNALQLQFQRRLLKGFQALASYTWSHSIDTASAGSFANGANLPASTANPNANRGSSDFDNRHAFSTGMTYAIPSPQVHPVISVITRGWSLQGIIQIHSAGPVSIVDSNFDRLTSGLTPDIRPDVTPGIPLYLYGRQYPGGKAINGTVGAVSGGCPDGSQSVGPFCPPPTDSDGNPLRQGNLGRNALRAFGLTQWDFAVHRDFPIRESLTLQFRAEMFNLLNHPNFAPPSNDITADQFGLSNQMFGQYLGGRSLGAGGFSALYQVGGPRSMQFALRLSF